MMALLRPIPLAPSSATDPTPSGHKSPWSWVLATAMAISLAGCGDAPGDEDELTEAGSTTGAMDADGDDESGEGSDETGTEDEPEEPSGPMTLLVHDHADAWLVELERDDAGQWQQGEDQLLPETIDVEHTVRWSGPSIIAYTCEIGICGVSRDGTATATLLRLEDYGLEELLHRFDISDGGRIMAATGTFNQGHWLLLEDGGTRELEIAGRDPVWHTEDEIVVGRNDSPSGTPGGIAVVDVLTGAEQRVLSLSDAPLTDPMPHDARDVALSPDGSTAAITAQTYVNGTPYRWTYLVTLDPAPSFVELDVSNETDSEPKSFSADGRLLSIPVMRTVYVIDVATAEVITTIEGEGAAFAPQ